VCGPANSSKDNSQGAHSPKAGQALATSNNLDGGGAALIGLGMLATNGDSRNSPAVRVIFCSFLWFV